MKKEDERMLKTIFEAREDKLAQINKADKEFVSKDDASRKKKYYALNNQLNKIPYNLNKIKKDLSKAIEEYVEAIDYENSYFNQKYYLNGLKDGIKLIGEIKD